VAVVHRRAPTPAAAARIRRSLYGARVLDITMSTETGVRYEQCLFWAHYYP